MTEASPPSAFTELPLSPALLAVVADLGFTALTPIQAQAIPALLAGPDLVGQSKTGSGKTAAYALPLLNALDLAKREVFGVIVCPTRELSAQVARELRKLGRHVAGISVVVLSGGEAVRERLYRQVAGTVRWERCVQKLGALGATVAVEVGPGKVLSGLVKRICPTIATHQFADPSGLAELQPLVAATAQRGAS